VDGLKDGKLFAAARMKGHRTAMAARRRRRSPDADPLILSHDEEVGCAGVRRHPYAEGHAGPPRSSSRTTNMRVGSRAGQLGALPRGLRAILARTAGGRAIDTPPRSSVIRWMGELQS
jgi:hypothetical protein